MADEPDPLLERSCALCGTSFVPLRSDSRFCRTPDCKRQRQRARWRRWASKDGSRDKVNDYQRSYRSTEAATFADVRRRYGLTPDQYRRLLEVSGGSCPVCEGASGEPLCIDHCHATGEVRGMLCRRCNRALGLLGDTIADVERLAGYLRSAASSTIVVGSNRPSK
jgi:hypothetical protein